MATGTQTQQLAQQEQAYRGLREDAAQAAQTQTADQQLVTVERVELHPEYLALREELNAAVSEQFKAYIHWTCAPSYAEEVKRYAAYQFAIEKAAALYRQSIAWDDACRVRVVRQRGIGFSSEA